MNFRNTSVAALAAAIIFAAGTVSATTLGYWRFENGAPGTNAVGAGSITDETGTHHGTPHGDPNYQSNVPVSLVPQTGAANNGSLFFDAVGDYVSIAHSAGLDPVSQFTVELWMKVSPANIGGHHLVIDTSHGFTDSTGWVLQGGPDGRLFFGIGSGGAGAGGFPGVASTDVLADDVWHHVAGVYDSTDIGSEVKLYVDGVLNGTAAAAAYASNNRDINIGAAWGGGAFQRFLNGSVDEVRISDAALTASEFLNAAPQTAIPAPAGLIFPLVALGLIAVRRRR